GDFRSWCNLDTVALEPLEEPHEIAEVKEMVQRHAKYTHSELGWRVLAMWDELIPKFVKVMPKDYRRMLEAVQRAEAAGLSGDEAVMVAFGENKKDAARVGGTWEKER